MPAEPNQNPAPCPNSVVASGLRGTRRLSRRRPACAWRLAWRACDRECRLADAPVPGPARSVRAPPPSPPFDPSTLGPAGRMRQGVVRRASGPTRYSITACELWGLPRTHSVSAGEVSPILESPVDALWPAAGDGAVAAMSHTLHVSPRRATPPGQGTPRGDAHGAAKSRLRPIPAKASPNRGAGGRIATFERLDRGEGPRHSPRADEGAAPT